MKQPTAIEFYVQNEKILDELKKNNRLAIETGKQFKEIKDSLDRIYNDRDLFKNFEGDIAGVKSAVLALDSHNETLNRDGMQKTIEVIGTVEKKAEEIKDHTEAVTGEHKSFISKLREKVNKE